MEFRILSHAAMWVRCGGTSVVIDPWLVGSCYWRSWWNFPRAVFDEREMAAVDAVILSHQHWDHWHGPSLRKLFAGKPVLIPDEPALRSGRDLQTIGFRDVRRLPHGKTVEIGALRITLYQFGRYVNDAAIVVEGDGVTLLNANDAKIAGWPLRHLVARHGPIDFAFRSHSSANARVCWRLEGDTAYVVDDHEHYMRSFVQFMDAVQPRYAVPFASNHCHLHDDVFALQRDDRHAARAARARAQPAAAALGAAGDAAGLALAKGRGRAAGQLRSGAGDAVRRHAGDACAPTAPSRRRPWNGSASRRTPWSWATRCSSAFSTSSARPAPGRRRRWAC